MKIDTASILLNPILGARVLWPAINEYQKSFEHIPLSKVLLVLPIVFHERSRKMIYNMHMAKGSVGKAMNKKNDDILMSGNDLSLGLQERLESYMPLTLSSLNLGIASGLFLSFPGYDQISEFPRYGTELKKLPTELVGNIGDDDEKQKASQRLGAWFSTARVEAIYSALKVNV